jgi:hypothetical protein
VVGRGRSTQKINKLRTKKKYFKKKGFGTAHPPNLGGSCCSWQLTSRPAVAAGACGFFLQKKIFLYGQGPIVGLG